MLRSLILVAMGGAVGSVFRHLTTVLVNRFFHSLFPWATFTANVLGCLIIGILLGLFERQQITNPELKYLLITGFCGGFTTFSAFTSENYQLLQSGHTLTAFLYMGISIVLSLFAIGLGLILTKI